MPSSKHVTLGLLQHACGSNPAANLRTTLAAAPKAPVSPAATVAAFRGYR